MNKASFSVVQRCLNTMPSAIGFSAYQMVFGSNPVDLFGWEGGGEDLMFAQDTSLAGQFVQQWKLRMKAARATLKEIANSELRRLLARTKTFSCAEIDVGDMALFYKARSRKSSPRRTGPAKVLEIDATGETVSFQSQNFKVDRYGVRKRMKDSEVTERDGEFFSTSGGTWMGRRMGTLGWFRCCRRMCLSIMKWGMGRCRLKVKASQRRWPRSPRWHRLA